MSDNSGSVVTKVSVTKGKEYHTSLLGKLDKISDREFHSRLMKWCENCHKPLLRVLSNCIAIYKTKFPLKSIPNEKDTEVILKSVIAW